MVSLLRAFRAFANWRRLLLHIHAKRRDPPPCCNQYTADCISQNVCRRLRRALFPEGVKLQRT